MRVSEISSAAQMEEALSFWRTEFEARCVIDKGVGAQVIRPRAPQAGSDVFDLPSKSAGRALDGSAYSAWR